MPDSRIIFTVGHNKKSLEHFIALLKGAGVDAVIDVRLRNTSQLAGFAKRDDLAFLLRQAFGIAYEHRPELAPTAEILDKYKADGNWATYQEGFQALLGERGLEDLASEILGRYRRPCLLCSESSPEHCHRRLVAEAWAGQLPNVEVIHLR